VEFNGSWVQRNPTNGEQSLPIANAGKHQFLTRFHYLPIAWHAFVNPFQRKSIRRVFSADPDGRIFCQATLNRTCTGQIPW